MWNSLSPHGRRVIHLDIRGDFSEIFSAVSAEAIGAMKFSEWTCPSIDNVFFLNLEISLGQVESVSMPIVD